jgi:hypothetical protein
VGQEPKFENWFLEPQPSPLQSLDAVFAPPTLHQRKLLRLPRGGRAASASLRQLAEREAGAQCGFKVTIAWENG